jgi:phosphoribosylanthranilate isomerase
LKRDRDIAAISLGAQGGLVMTVRVKICGLTQRDEALGVVAAGADAVGVVFVPGTPRAVTPEQAAAILRELPPLVARVGLFVDATVEHIRTTVQQVGLDTVQLHGEETPEVCREVRRFARVLKAFRVRGPETVARLSAYGDEVDAFLLDAYVPGVAGGTGATFDWTQAVAAQQFGRPIILAGGLTPATVAEAVRQVRPYAVDVSSGVERATGRKDLTKVRELVAAVRRAAAQLD